jgi:hypothetical protein
VEKLKELNHTKVGMAITGGGLQFPANLLALGGMSDIIEFVDCPYGKLASDKYISQLTYSGPKIHNYRSWDFSYLLALGAFCKLDSLYLNFDSRPDLISIGSSGVLYTENQREDRENTVYITIMDSFKDVDYKTSFNTSKNRKDQEKLADDFIFRCFMNFLGLHTDQHLGDSFSNVCIRANRRYEDKK